MAIMNKKGDRASWKIPVWILVSVKLLLPAINSTLKVFIASYCYYYYYYYSSELKILKYFGNVRHNSAVFAEVIKVTNHTRLWDAEFAWYFPMTTYWICLNGLKHDFWIYVFRPTWPHYSSCNSGQISRTIWSLYWHQLHLQLSQNECFPLLSWCYGPSLNS